MTDNQTTGPPEQLLAICIRCRHCDPAPGYPPANLHVSRCNHPRVKPIEGKCVVTGGKALYLPYPPWEPVDRYWSWPSCIEVNPAGNCRLFEASD